MGRESILGLEGRTKAPYLDTIDGGGMGRPHTPKDARKPRVSETMRRVKSKDTAPEMLLRKALTREGLRYRVAPSRIIGKPDIVFPSARVAVFVDGDFWHGNQWQRRGHASVAEQFRASETQEYWLRKLASNMSRDCRVTAELLRDGWTILRLWESDIHGDIAECVEMTKAALEDPAPYSSESRRTMNPDRSVAEFFAGIGLMRMGLEKAGWRVVYANDIDPLKRDMYLAQYPDRPDEYVCEDIHRLRGADMPSVTLATASFPCTDLSLAGGRKGLSGRQSSAFWEFVRILDDMGSRRPPMVLIENVPGFLTSHKGKDFSDALQAMNRLGYTVDALVIDAARFVPQSRARLFVIGVMEEPRRASEPQDTLAFFESDARPAALADFVTMHPFIRWSIRNTPPLPTSSTALPSILENVPLDSPQWWSRARVDYLLNQMSPRHRDMAQSMSSSKKWSFGTVFRRVRSGRSMAELRTDGIAGCLRTPKGGSAKQILVMAGGGEIHARLLTPRECARLMGADDYRITVPDNQALFGFGDAVCVPVVEWLARNYLEPVLSQLIRGVPLVLAAGG